MSRVTPPSPPARPVQNRWVRAVRFIRHSSLALQIGVAICAATLLLIVAGTLMVRHLLNDFSDELRPPFVYIDGVAGIEVQTLEARQAEFALRTWRIVVTTLVGGAIFAGLFAWWITRRVLQSAQRLANTANRISGRSLQERLITRRIPSELQPVALSFNQMLDRLEDAFTRLSGFSSDVAHDLRAPVHSLMTAAQVTLAQPRTADEYRDVLEMSIPVYEKMGKLIENILFLARADQAQPWVHAARIDLVKKLSDITAFFEILAHERGVELELRMHGAQVLWADETMVLRALANLLTNAIRHARDGSTVVLSATPTPDGGCEMAVANEGEPIAPEIQARIFERNYRAVGDRKDAGRSGLGLAIVRSTMSMHGGSVRVDSAAGRPTVFTLHFPPEPATGPEHCPEAGESRPSRAG